MPESYSLNDLFKAGLTREQFIAKYGEIKNAENKPDSSIFAENMANAVGQMFDTLNTDGNETLDEGEIEILKSMAEGDDNSVLSEADLEMFYQKIAENIAKTYASTDPAKMYASAMQASGGASYSTYVEDLDSQINTLNDLISARKNNSAFQINQLQSQIDDMILKSTKLNNDFKEKYKNASNKAKSLQAQINANSAKINAKKLESINAKNDEALLEREIASLDPEKDKDEIEQKKSELKKLRGNSNGLKSELITLEGIDRSLTSELKETKSLLSKLTDEAMSKDNEIQSRITELKGRITSEEDKAKNDIENYENQQKILQSAKEYAYTQMETAISEGEFSSHNNDNLMTFDELSAQGLKYSSEKGQKLAQDIGSHAHGFIGKCSNRVSNGLQRTGLGNERMPSAHMMDDKLREDIRTGKNTNFREIKVTSQEQLRSLPAGCIIVYEAGAAGYNSTHGHIEVSLGNGTAASDGITRNMRFTQNMSVFVPVENA